MQDGIQKVVTDTETENKPTEEVDYYSLSPDKLDETLNQFEVLPDTEEETPEVEETEDTEKTPETDTKTEDEKQTVPETKEPATTTEEPLINEAFISKYDKEEQKILQKYIGKPISEIVKALANANELIGRKTSEVKREIFPQSNQDIIAPKTPMVFPKDQKAEEAEALINKLVLDRIASSKTQLGFSEEFVFPPTLDIKSPEYKAWYKTANYDNPVDLRIFESVSHTEREGLREGYNEVVRLRSEYMRDNDKIIDNEIVNINEYFTRAKINLKDYGVDFSDKAIESLIFIEKDGKKVLDDKMFDWYNGEIPVMKTGALATKFMNTQGAEILSNIVEATLERGRREGAELNKNVKKPINKGLGNTDIGGQINVEKNSSDRDPYTLSLADLDREIKYQLSKE